MVRLPDPILELRADGPDLEPARHSAKAAGLQRLLRLGLAVPSGFVIPVASAAAIAENPAAAKTDIGTAMASTGLLSTLAVRSGAAVSLPGALETQLGVRPEDVGAAVVTVVRSADSPHARATAEALGHDGAPKTAVIVQRLIDPTADSHSGAGAATSCDPVTGAAGPVGSFLWERQGGEVMSGSASARPLDAIAERLPDVHARLVADLGRLAVLERSPVEVEFAIERGALWYLQLRRLTVDRREGADATTLDATVIAVGTPASAGVGRGRLHVDIDDALDAIDRGEAVVLIRPTTSPADVAAIVRSAAMVTTVGSRESHAAVVARSVGIPAVVGVGELTIGADHVGVDGVRVEVGSEMIVDGSVGRLLVPGPGG